MAKTRVDRLVVTSRWLWQSALDRQLTPAFQGLLALGSMTHEFTGGPLLRMRVRSHD